MKKDEITDFVVYYKEVLALALSVLQKTEPNLFYDYGNGEEYDAGNIIDQDLLYTIEHRDYKLIHIKTTYSLTSNLVEKVLAIIPIDEVPVIDCATNVISTAIGYLKFIGSTDSYDGDYFDNDAMPTVVKPTIVYHKPIMEFI